LTWLLGWRISWLSAREFEMIIKIKPNGDVVKSEGSYIVTYRNNVEIDRMFSGKF
jgi:hypothetical protein